MNRGHYTMSMKLNAYLMNEIIASENENRGEVENRENYKPKEENRKQIMDLREENVEKSKRFMVTDFST